MSGVQEPDGFSVVAIIAAYNEEDIIAAVVGDLIAQGVSVYLLDHHSSDGTAAAVETFLGRGLLGIERFPAPGSVPEEAAQVYSLRRIFKRREELARQLGASWYLNHDADELKESPWRHLDLRAAIRLVDGLGYNAIDFQIFDFCPTDDGFRGGDPRPAFEYYAPAAPYNRLQIRCFRRPEGPLDLVSSGGHEAVFPHRKVFPIRFISRHYPFRSQAHAERKLWDERLSRYDPEERALGWHVQYDGIARGHRFVRDPVELLRWDPDRVRVQLALRHREVERLEGDPQAVRQARESAECERDLISGLLDERNREVERLSGELDQRNHELAAAEERRAAELSSLELRIGELDTALATSRAAQAASQGRLEEVLHSRSWRWTVPLRWALQLLRGY